MEVDENLILTFLNVIENNDSANDDDIILTLLSLGIDQIVAQKLYALVPLAFGRVIISHIEDVELSDCFDLLDQGKKTSLAFKDEPIYVEALRLAVSMTHMGPRELVEPVTFMSGEFRAFNQALLDGIDLKGAKLLNPTISDISLEDWTRGNRLAGGPT